MIDLLIVGCGNMGEAILNRLASTEMKIACLEIDDVKRLELSKRFSNVDFISHISEDGISVENLLLAIKPQIFKAFSTMNRDKIRCNGVISIMAGVKIDAMESYFSGKCISRIMPNTPALLGEAASGYCLNDEAKTNRVFIESVENILSVIGVSIQVPSENLIDAVTGVSGSGPAYFFSIIDAMIEAGVKNGLTANDSQILAAQTMKGAAEMILKGDASISELKYSVMSPGGTTAAGISALESNGMRKAIHACVDATVNKSKELGK